MRGSNLGRSEEYWEALVKELNDLDNVKARFFPNNDCNGEIIRIRVQRTDEKAALESFPIV